MNPKTLKRSVSEPIKADASAGQLKNAIYLYYKEEVGVDIDVSRHYENASGDEVTS